MKLLRLLVCSLLLNTACRGSNPVPVVMPPPSPPPAVVPATAPMSAYSGKNLTTFALWQDSTPETAAFTNVMTLSIGCGDDAAYANAVATLARDPRRVVWFANMFSFGPTSRSTGGYSLRQDASACWQQLRALIAAHLDRTVAVWLLDEPDSVAFGDKPTSGYDPNLYNDIITTACAMVHANFPSVTVALNYGGAEPGLQVPACLGLVGVETYRTD